jgi:hypothetical protein
MTLARLLVFLGIVVGVLFLIHFYIWRRVLVPAALPYPWNRIATIALFGLMAMVPLMFLTLRSAPNWFVVPVAWVASQDHEIEPATGKSKLRNCSSHDGIRCAGTGLDREPLIFEGLDHLAGRGGDQCQRGNKEQNPLHRGEG